MSAAFQPLAHTVLTAEAKRSSRGRMRRMSSAPDPTPPKGGAPRPAGKVVHLQRGLMFSCAHCGEWIAASSNSHIEMEAKQSRWVQRVTALLLLILLIGQFGGIALLYRQSAGQANANEHWRKSDDSKR